MDNPETEATRTKIKGKKTNKNTTQKNKNMS